MALTASTGFRLRAGVDMDSIILLDIRVKNSSTVRIGDVVRVDTNGFALRATGTEPVGGVVLGIVDKSGTPPFTAFYINNTGATITGDDTVTTSSSNQTRTDNWIEVQIAFDPAGQYLYYNDADADLAQEGLFQFFDTTNSNQITGAGGDANGQFQCVGIDPDNDGDLSKGLFRINESHYSGGVDSATAKRS